MTNIMSIKQISDIFSLYNEAARLQDLHIVQLHPPNIRPLVVVWGAQGVTFAWQKKKTVKLVADC